MGSRKGAVVGVVVMTRRTQRGCPKGGQRCPEKAIYEKGGLFLFAASSVLTARISASFCCGVPMVMRKYSPMEGASNQRTRILCARSLWSHCSAVHLGGRVQRKLVWLGETLKLSSVNWRLSFSRAAMILRK